MNIETVGLWGGFLVALAFLLFIDLFVVHRKSHAVGVREALGWTGIWITLALIFGGGVFIFAGSDKGTEYLTGYVIEKSLSVDNVFIFLIIFQYFAVPPHLQPKVLHWGIFGALAMRLAFILVGAALLDAFHWMIYVFGGILLVTAARLALQGEQEVHPEKNPLIKLLKRFIPITQDYNENNFFTRRNGVLMATPLFAVLVMIESTDLVFAIDSIPAIFAVTRDPFIVFTSNAFAILGLRALYFALAGVMVYFTYLRQGLVVILAFVGTKMVISDVYHFPTLASLGIVVGVLTVSVLASIIVQRRRGPDAPEGHKIVPQPALTTEGD